MEAKDFLSELIKWQLKHKDIVDSPINISFEQNHIEAVQYAHVDEIIYVSPTKFKFNILGWKGIVDLTKYDKVYFDEWGGQ